MSDKSCEKCGAYVPLRPASDAYFHCSQINQLLVKHQQLALAKICKHYPVPKPKPEPSEFEKWSQNFNLLREHEYVKYAKRGWQACRKRFYEKGKTQGCGIFYAIQQIADELDADKEQNNAKA